MRYTFVQQCGDALESLARQIKVELVPVPGYKGIPVHEKANQLARLQPGAPGQGPEPIFQDVDKPMTLLMDPIDLGWCSC